MCKYTFCCICVSRTASACKVGSLIFLYFVNFPLSLLHIHMFFFFNSTFQTTRQCISIVLKMRHVISGNPSSMTLGQCIAYVTHDVFLQLPCNSMSKLHQHHSTSYLAERTLTLNLCLRLSNVTLNFHRSSVSTGLTVHFAAEHIVSGLKMA